MPGGEGVRRHPSQDGVSIKSTDRKKLIDIAATSIAGRSTEPAKDYLAGVVVEATSSMVEQVDKNTIADVYNVKVEKKHEGLHISHTDWSVKRRAPNAG